MLLPLLILFLLMLLLGVGLLSAAAVDLELLGAGAAAALVRSSSCIGCSGGLVLSLIAVGELLQTLICTYDWGVVARSRGQDAVCCL
jgi:hypothetical protein